MSGQDAAAAMRCPVCEFVYDPVAGLPREGYPAGTAFADLPDDFFCPDCGVRDKADFEPVDQPAHVSEDAGSPR